MRRAAVSTNLLEEMTQVADSGCLFIHGTRRPDAHIAWLDSPSLGSVLTWHAPFLFGLRFYLDASRVRGAARREGSNQAGVTDS